MVKTEVPEAIINAINAMLAPYGKKYEDNDSMVTPIKEPRYINVATAAAYSGISPWLVRFGARNGFYSSRKVGDRAQSRKLIIDKKSFDNWIENQRTGQTTGVKITEANR